MLADSKGKKRVYSYKGAKNSGIHAAIVKCICVNKSNAYRVYKFSSLMHSNSKHRKNIG